MNTYPESGKDRKKSFSLDMVSEKTVKFRCGVGIFRYVPFPFPIPERKLFLTVRHVLINITSNGKQLHMC
jgi:hypothetical protein